MVENDENWFDSDIAVMALSYGEKAGLQIYRNYTRSFEDHAISRFVEALDREKLDLSDLSKMLTLIIHEDVRFLPVVACAYADDALRDAFRLALPDGIPGGKANMFSGFGPLSSLSKRIQLAYAFDIMSADLMRDVDRLRSVRNEISHSGTSALCQTFSREVG